MMMMMPLAFDLFLHSNSMRFDEFQQQFKRRRFEEVKKKKKKNSVHFIDKLKLKNDSK